jgi:hypothetical protein
MANMGKAAGEAEENSDHVTVNTVDFHHPYTPYDIQETFMGTVYQVLEDGKVGILESPTGTVSPTSPSRDRILTGYPACLYNLFEQACCAITYTTPNRASL